MRRDLFEDFCREYVRELNRLRMEHRAGLSSARTELVAVEREIRKLVQAIKNGVSAYVDQGRDPLTRSQESRTAVTSRSAKDGPEQSTFGGSVTGDAYDHAATAHEDRPLHPCSTG